MLAKTKVIISEDDYKRIHALLDTLPRCNAVYRMIDELERAQVIASEEMPTNVVGMHSRVTFTLPAKKKTFTYKLVYPHEATTDDTLSVLTPVGSALLGLTVGQEIEWPLEGSKNTRVRVDAIQSY